MEQNIWISSRQNATVQAAVKLHEKKERTRSGTFCFEGVKLLKEAIFCGIPLRAVFVTSSCAEQTADLLEQLDPSVQRFTVTQAVYDKLSLEKAPQGVFCIAAALDKTVKTVTMYEGASPANSAVTEKIFLCENLQDPGNVGTVLRTAAALGIDRLCLCGCAELYHPRVVRAAMGALFRQRIDLCTDAAAYLHSLRRAGYVPLAAMPRADGLRLGTDALPPAVVFAVGNEGHGLSAAAAQACCGAVQIPMTPGSESLNAAAAAALLIWETVRREERI